MCRSHPVRLIEEHRVHPPRPALVEHEGAWSPGWQCASRARDDTRGWMAEVTWPADHDWGPGNYSTMVTPQRVQPVDRPYGGRRPAGPQR